MSIIAGRSAERRLPGKQVKFLESGDQACRDMCSEIKMTDPKSVREIVQKDLNVSWDGASYIAQHDAQLDCMGTDSSPSETIAWNSAHGYPEIVLESEGEPGKLGNSSVMSCGSNLNSKVHQRPGKVAFGDFMNSEDGRRRSPSSFFQLKLNNVHASFQESDLDQRMDSATIYSARVRPPSPYIPLPRSGAKSRLDRFCRPPTHEGGLCEGPCEVGDLSFSRPPTRADDSSPVFSRAASSPSPLTVAAAAALALGSPTMDRSPVRGRPRHREDHPGPRRLRVLSGDDVPRRLSLNTAARRRGMPSVEGSPGVATEPSDPDESVLGSVGGGSDFLRSLDAADDFLGSPSSRRDSLEPSTSVANGDSGAPRRLGFRPRTPYPAATTAASASPPNRLPTPIASGRRAGGVRCAWGAAVPATVVEGDWCSKCRRQMEVCTCLITRPYDG